MMTLTETIGARQSVRTFKPMPLLPDEINAVQRLIDAATDPFGGRCEIRLQQFDIKGPARPGTYGVVRGASHYLLMAYADDEVSALSAGYRMERVVLGATAMGLGTCWIAGTLRSGQFDRGQQWPAGLSLKIVSPIGHPADKRSLLERIARRAIGSDGRKPFGELFSDTAFGQPLAPDSLYAHPLAMLRLAPSSTNSQPWRAVVDGRTVHFYTRSSGHLATLDCGIALCHFHLAAQEAGLCGAFHTLSDYPTPPSGFRYLLSYTATPKH